MSDFDACAEPQPPHPAPLFSQFWRASEINPARGLLLRERVERDATESYLPPRPRFAAAARPLPAASAKVVAQWSGRHSVRQFSPQPLAWSALSDLLWPLSARADGRRTLASGGGKYPLWVHVAGLRMEGEAPSLAWYDPQCHGLTRLPQVLHWSTLEPLLRVQTNMPAAVLVITAEPAGHLRKYGERGGRFALLEAGSYLGALQLETARAGLGGLVVGAFADRLLLHALGPHVQNHLLMGVYVLGHPA